MTLAIILDTETTGVVDPEVIQLAHTVPLQDPSALYEPTTGCHQKRFKPKGPISLGAMATHHIIPEDLVDCPPWPGTWSPPEGVQYVIGHNIDFDWKAIGSPHVARICTLALARSLYPEIDSHSLSALVYYLSLRDVARERLKRAHDAVADVQLCHFVLIELLKSLPGMQSWHQLWQVSEKARIPKVMPVGKHKGMPIAKVPADYKRWFLNQPDVDPYLAKALRGEAA